MLSLQAAAIGSPLESDRITREVWSSLGAGWKAPCRQQECQRAPVRKESRGPGQTRSSGVEALALEVMSNCSTQQVLSDKVHRTC